MNESILNTIKKLLGITEEYTHFDQDLIVHINSVFMTLYQLGIGTKPFVIENAYDEWSDFIDNPDDLSQIKTYVYLRVKMIFDPPSSGIISEAYNKTISEYEWRLSISVDPGKGDE